jgi:hypothetical protein
MPTGTIVSLDEYLSTTSDPDCEYVDGELIERNTAESIAADRYRPFGYHRHYAKDPRTNSPRAAFPLHRDSLP